MSNILVTGCTGQIGSELIPALKLASPTTEIIGISKDDFDIRDKSRLSDLLTQKKIDTIYHLASLLSVTSEQDPQAAWEINLGSLKTVLDFAKDQHLKVFWPSSIAAFGPTTPKHTPQHTIMEPTTLYGVTKVAGELLCQYYFTKHGVDVRSLRFPGVISWKTHPGGGTTDYAVAMFYAALKSETYPCYLSPSTSLPMIYITDVISATLQLMAADPGQLTVRTSYNLSGFSLTPIQLFQAIAARRPFQISYLPDSRQQIADSWPDSIDATDFCHDLAWTPQYDLERTVTIMLDQLSRV